MDNKNIEFYIFNEGGIPMFGYPNSKVDFSFITSFAGALQKFSQKIAKDDISSINMKNKFMYFYKSKGYNIYYALITKKKEKENEIHSRMEEIAYVFEKKYENSIPNWKGNQKTFTEFSTYFNSNVERMAYILFGKIL